MMLKTWKILWVLVLMTKVASAFEGLIFRCPSSFHDLLMLMIIWWLWQCFFYVWLIIHDYSLYHEFSKLEWLLTYECFEKPSNLLNIFLHCENSTTRTPHESVYVCPTFCIYTIHLLQNHVIGTPCKRGYVNVEIIVCLHAKWHLWDMTPFWKQLL